MAVTASMAEAYLLPRLVALRERSAEEGEAALTRTIGLVLMLVAPAGVSFWTLCEPFAALAISPGLSGQFVAISALATACAALYTFQAYVLRPAFQMGLSTMPLLQSAALALAVNFAVLWSLAGTPENVATAHLAGLAAGCVWLLGRALIGLRVRWPVADTLRSPRPPSSWDGPDGPLPAWSRGRQPPFSSGQQRWPRCTGWRCWPWTLQPAAARARPPQALTEGRGLWATA
jgi:hypothetical protein